MDDEHTFHLHHRVLHKSSDPHASASHHEIYFDENYTPVLHSLSTELSRELSGMHDLTLTAHGLSELVEKFQIFQNRVVDFQSQSLAQQPLSPGARLMKIPTHFFHHPQHLTFRTLIKIIARELHNHSWSTANLLDHVSHPKAKVLLESVVNSLPFLKHPRIFLKPSPEAKESLIKTIHQMKGGLLLKLLWLKSNHSSIVLEIIIDCCLKLSDCRFFNAEIRTRGEWRWMVLA